MLLLTNGTVMVQANQTGNWWGLTPNSSGSYVNGTWKQLASMPAGYAPKYYASAILPDGRVLVEGGEYNGTNTTAVDTNRGAIYNPVANTWTAVNPPSGWTHIGDAVSTVLTNGEFMMGNLDSTAQVLFNPSTLTWQPVGTGKADKNSEEGWSLLRNGQVLTVDTENGRNSEVFTPSTGAWTNAGTLPVTLPSNGGMNIVPEVGPLLLRPNGTVFAAGATKNTAIYNTASATWSTGPSFPQGVSADGPAVVLPDGDVLVPSSPFFQPPEHFYDFNGSSFRLVTDPPGASTTPTFSNRMLVVPTGQVLVSDGASIYVYTDNGTPLTSWRPTISSVPSTLAQGATYRASGTQLNGLTQASAYGDDNQDATNYPLVRITNNATRHVSYARTSGMTTMTVNPGATSSANFTIPATAELGPSTLQVVANGIASAPLNVTVSGWAIVPSANPTGATTSYLFGVSCTSTTNCFAVGYFANGSGKFTLVERWNGTSWAFVSSPNPTGATESYLQGVSCTSTTNCFAVGYANSSGQVTLVERWNGTSWAIVSSPNPTGGTYNELQGVSCTSTTNCFAVGSFIKDPGAFTLVERWNGASWAIVSSPNPNGATISGLWGVSCASATSCFAVGFAYNGSGDLALVERWNGTSWAIVSSPNPTGATNSYLLGVSCTSTTNCFAVGYFYNGSSYFTLVERWNGTSWAIVSSPNSTGATNSLLLGVSCTSTTNCFAVGNFSTSSGSPTLVERWNGTSWTIVPSPNPTGTTESGLYGVSCTSTTNCFAVGSFANGSGGQSTLVERRS